MTQPVHTPEVVLRIPASHLALLLLAKLIYQSMQGNPHFTSFTTQLAALLVLITAFETTITTKGPNAGSQRWTARQALVAALKHLADDVQGVAETVISDAVNVIEGSGMFVKRNPQRAPRVFSVKQGDASGLLLIIAKAMRGPATYYWQMSLDQKTWTTLPDTIVASTSVSGLTAGQTYYFRYRTLSRAGASDYSQVISFLAK